MKKCVVPRLVRGIQCLLTRCSPGPALKLINDPGFILVTTLIFLMIFMTFLAFAVNQSQMEKWMSNNYVQSQQSFIHAQNLLKQVENQLLSHQLKCYQKCSETHEAIKTDYNIEDLGVNNCVKIRNFKDKVGHYFEVSVQVFDRYDHQTISLSSIFVKPEKILNTQEKCLNLIEIEAGRQSLAYSN